MLKLIYQSAINNFNKEVMIFCKNIKIKIDRYVFLEWSNFDMFTLDIFYNFLIKEKF